MSRPRLIHSDRLPYHLYGRANNREWFHLPLSEVWAVFLRHLRVAVVEHGFLVHAFVLMSNHYHLLGTATGLSVDRVMCRLLKGISDEVNRRAGRTNHTFGGPYRWTLIEDWFHYHHAFRYVYQNPLRAGLCTDVSQYPFSTLGGLVGTREPGVPITSHPFERLALKQIRRNGKSDWIPWLNEPYDAAHVDGLRRALSRRKFRFCLGRGSRKLPRQFVNVE